MPNYLCKCCDFQTKLKGDYKRHLKTKKHEVMFFLSTKNNNCQQFDNNLTTICQHKNMAEHKCKYCDKCFKHRQSMYRHIKYYCKKSHDEGIQEYVNLLNEKEQEIKEKDLALKNSSMQLVKIEKQLSLLTKKLQIKNINNGVYIQGNLHNIQNINLNLLNYNETNYEYLTDKDYIKCIKDCNSCVKTLIEKVHFNKNHPENMNIYISSIKGNFIMVYRNNKWHLTTRKEQIDDLYENNELMLENWYNEYHEKYPHIIKSFKKYLQNKEHDDEFIQKIKDEILLVLYNQRDLIKETNTFMGNTIEDNIENHLMIHSDELNSNFNINI